MDAIAREVDAAAREEVGQRKPEGEAHEAAHHAVAVLPVKNELELLHRHGLALLPLGELLVVLELRRPLLGNRSELVRPPRIISKVRPPNDVIKKR